MPKRTFQFIMNSSDLKYSKVYGVGIQEPTGLNDPRYPSVIKSNYKGVQGYTGYNRIRKQPTEDEYIRQHLNRRKPGYTGYIPGVMAETIFGKTFGSIASACSRNNKQT